MSEIVPQAGTAPATIDAAGALMAKIRPQWQARNLIERVRVLLPVDPSSACQRLLNAAIQDLREKVQIAGIDIATETAAAHKLPPIRSAEDVEKSYSTFNLIDLAYRMGLLSRPEWRRLSRAYEIRRDLEHEDSEYEATVEDCIYIFTTCIGAVLSRDPIAPIKVSDVKEIIQASGPVAPDADLVEDFGHAPDPRQLEILKFLVSMALSTEGLDVVRANAYRMLQDLAAGTRNGVRVELATDMQKRQGRRPLDEVEVRVAHAAGVVPYLRKQQRAAFFSSQLDELKSIGFQWRSHAAHGEPLRKFTEYGGLSAIPEDVRTDVLRWMVLCYIGEPGGYGEGRNRPVFYSNSAAPIIESLFLDGREAIREQVLALQSDRAVERACKDQHVARRFQDLLDLVQA